MDPEHIGNTWETFFDLTARRRDGHMPAYEASGCRRTEGTKMAKLRDHRRRSIGRPCAVLAKGGMWLERRGEEQRREEG